NSTPRALMSEELARRNPLEISWLKSNEENLAFVLLWKLPNTKKNYRESPDKQPRCQRNLWYCVSDMANAIKNVDFCLQGTNPLLVGILAKTVK
ncbi:hypothetical protein ACTXT7_006016, partial [Hymenolepis weldensis]